MNPYSGTKDSLQESVSRNQGVVYRDLYKGIEGKFFLEMCIKGSGDSLWICMDECIVQDLVFLTIFPVKQYFRFDLLFLVQCLLDFGLALNFCVFSVQEFTGTVLPHDMRPGMAGELTEAIGTIHDRKAVGQGVTQDKVTV